MSKIRKIVGFLLFLAILWFIYDNFDFLAVKVSNEGTKYEIEAGNYETITGMTVRPLKVETVSFTNSYNGNIMEIEIQNIDEYAGNVTVLVDCPRETKEKTRFIKPGDIKIFKFADMKGECGDYVIKSGNIEIKN